MLNQDEPYPTQLLEKEEDKYIYNSVAYQSKDSKVNACGSHVVHCIYRLKNTLPAIVVTTALLIVTRRIE